MNEINNLAITPLAPIAFPATIPLGTQSLGARREFRMSSPVQAPADWVPVERRLLGMDRSTVTANLKPLERMGAVIMVVDASDRRERRIVLTDVGRDLLARAMPIWIREHGKIDAALTDRGDILRRGLVELIDAGAQAA